MSYQIINGDCLEVMETLQSHRFDCILTSPPYNNCRSKELKSTDCYGAKYDIIDDMKTETEYINWTVELFKQFDRLIKNNGVVLYNISYTPESPNQMLLAMAEIVKCTNFNLADLIIWKKNNAIPNNRSSCKLTRIVEFVYCFCKKGYDKKFISNKKALSYNNKKKQYYYENIFNFVEAKNNDGVNELNRATYSVELCNKLLDIYVKEGMNVLDPFNGTGTTGAACVLKNINYLGIELSEQQVEFSRKRIEEELKSSSLNLI